MISSPQSEEMSSGNDELEAELDAEAMQEAAGGKQDFRYALRKFHNHSKNFAILAKFLLCTFFRYASEISLS